MIYKSQADYIDEAPGKRKCSGCKMFKDVSIEANRTSMRNGKEIEHFEDWCTLVKGEINPQGVCRYWEKKTTLPVE